jgi:hypothetical protein
LESPCIKVCILDRQRGICVGCGRSLAEIASWSRMSDAERRSIMMRLAADGRSTVAPGSLPPSRSDR